MGRRVAERAESVFSLEIRRHIDQGSGEAQLLRVRKGANLAIESLSLL